MPTNERKTIRISRRRWILDSYVMDCTFVTIVRPMQTAKQFHFAAHPPFAHGAHTFTPAIVHSAHSMINYLLLCCVCVCVCCPIRWKSFLPRLNENSTRETCAHFPAKYGYTTRKRTCGTNETNKQKKNSKRTARTHANQYSAPFWLGSFHSSTIE